MKKLAVFTGTRAEYGLLYPLMRLIQKSMKFQLQTIVSGMHLSPLFGETWRLIEQDGFRIDEKVEMLLSSDSAQGVAKSVGIGTMGFADSLERLKPDCLIILGDRYEALAIAQAAAIMRIPIAHLHGGEITEGAYDDAIRHAITKLAYWHFVASEEYRQRVIQLGEAPERVWNVGAIGLENVRSVKRLSLVQVGEDIGFNLRSPFFLVTYHPVTAGNEDANDTFTNLLEALEAFPEHQVLFTYPNSDNGGQELISLIDRYVQRVPERAVAVKSLGLQRYLSAAAQCSAVIGNSSSGIIEVPSLQVPSVNIGIRQKGRLSSNSVIHVGTQVSAIREGIERSLTDEAKNVAQCADNPYGSGDTSSDILSIMESTGQPTPKVFYDLQQPEKD